MQRSDASAREDQPEEDVAVSRKITMPDEWMRLPIVADGNNAFTAVRARRRSAVSGNV
jgi:hypothetical protein